MISYENFPEDVHCVAVFQHLNPRNVLQQAIFLAFHRLNSEILDSSILTPYLRQNCRVGFEFGVAEGLDFNFLDQEELDKCLRIVDEKEVELMDFLFVMKYHLIKSGGKLVPLRFDYHFLSFRFIENGLELRVHHEKGTMRVSFDELIDFIIKEINIGLSDRMQFPLVLSKFVR